MAVDNPAYGGRLLWLEIAVLSPFLFCRALFLSEDVRLFWFMAAFLGAYGSPLKGFSFRPFQLADFSPSIWRQGHFHLLISRITAICFRFLLFGLLCSTSLLVCWRFLGTYKLSFCACKLGRIQRFRLRLCAWDDAIEVDETKPLCLRLVIQQCLAIAYYVANSASENFISASETSLSRFNF
jgi:hypothetical protein